MTAPRGCSRVCPHRPACPGCDWQELSYPEQLAGKAERVRRSCARYPALAAVTVAHPLGAEQQEQYRTRVKWAVRGDRIGLFGPGHQLVDTPHCLIAPVRAREVAAWLRRRPGEARGARLVALDLRVTARGDWAATFVIEAAASAVARAWAGELASWLGRVASPRPVYLAWSWHPPGAPTTLGRPPELLTGEPWLVDRIGLAECAFPPGAFSQVHAGQTLLLHRLLREALAGLPEHGGARLVDLYAGTGGMGLALADLVREVILVEAFGPAARAAQQGAVLPGVPVRVLDAQAEAALATLTATVVGPLAILVDPPRTGLGWSVLTALARARPAWLAYVSCEPATLARDLALLAGAGWRTERVQPVDLMPGTSQVESVALLRPGEQWSGTILHAGAGWRVIDRPPVVAPAMPPPEHTDVELPPELSGIFFELSPGFAEPPPGRITWTALVQGELATEQLLVRRVPGQPRPVAVRVRVQPVRQVGGHTLVELELEQGNSHGLRRLLALVGHPVLGDPRFGHAATNQHLAATAGLIRPFLHASRFTAADGRNWAAPLPPDLAQVLEELEEGGDDAPASPP